MSYSFAEHRYSRKHLLIVALTCGILGTAAIISSFAASVSTITGTVWQDTNRNGAVDAGEAPFADKTMYLFDGVTGTAIAAAQSDAAGKYSFANLADGQYRVAMSSPSWWSLRDAWVPTTGNTLKHYSQNITLVSTATANIGLRQLVHSTDPYAPISSYTAPSGLKVNSYVDVITAEEVYAALSKGALMGGAESQFVTVRFGLYLDGGNMTNAGVAGGIAGNPYHDYDAAAHVSYISWLDDGDRTLFHEYGHAWSLYYAYIVQQDPLMTDYQKVRGIYGDTRVNSNYEWQVNEIIAEDYRQLFGSPTSSGDGQINNSIPLAKDVPGLKEYLSGLFMTKDSYAPTAPLNLTGVSEDQAKVKLTWNASTDNLAVTGYDIYRSGQKVGSVSGSTTTYTDSNLTANTSYSYYVIARDAAGNSSSASNTITVKTLSQPPSAPTNLRTTSVNDTSVALAWTASTDNVGVTAYDIYRSGQKVGSVNGPSTTYFDTGLLPSTNYSYYVVARDAAGNTSAASNTVSLTTQAVDSQAPTKPTNLKVTSVTATAVNLSWSASTDNIGVISYHIYKVGSSTPIKTVSGTTASLTGLSPNTQYSFYVTANDAAGNQSQASTTVKARTARK